MEVKEEQTLPYSFYELKADSELKKLDQRIERLEAEKRMGLEDLRQRWGTELVDITPGGRLGFYKEVPEEYRRWTRKPDVQGFKQIKRNTKLYKDTLAYTSELYPSLFTGALDELLSTKIKLYRSFYYTQDHEDVSPKYVNHGQKVIITKQYIHPNDVFYQNFEPVF